MNLVVTVDTSQAVSGLTQLGRSLKEEVKVAGQKVGDRLERQARTRHRYRSRTGNLLSATQSETVGTVTTLYIDPARAPYGRYVHDGANSWAPDTFVYDAAEGNEPDIEDQYERAFDEAIQKAGF